MVTKPAIRNIPDLIAIKVSIYFFDTNVVIIKPIPNPANILPTNAKTFVLRKKNPTPIPKIKPPPIAHVLLSSFISLTSEFYEEVPEMQSISLTSKFYEEVPEMQSISLTSKFYEEVPEMQSISLTSFLFLNVLIYKPNISNRL